MLCFSIVDIGDPFVICSWQTSVDTRKSSGKEISASSHYRSIKEEHGRKMLEKHNLTFPVVYGLNVRKEADKIGGYFDSEHGYFQPANFILRDRKVVNATYSSGPLAGC